MASEAAEIGRRKRAWDILLPLATVLLVTGTFLQAHRKNAIQRESAALINLSGRQRMLSQRAVLIAVQLSSAEGRREKDLREELRKLIDRFERTHFALLNGSPAKGLSPPASPTVLAIFQDEPHRLHAQVSEFVSLARDFLKDPHSSDADAPLHALVFTPLESDLLVSLDALVSQFQREAEAHAATAEWLLIFWVVVTVLCVTTTLFVMAPFSPGSEGAAPTTEEPMLSRMMGLANRLQNSAPLVLAVSFTAIGMAVYWSHSSVASEVRESQAFQEAEVRTQLLNRLRTVYSEDAVERLRERSEEATHDFAMLGSAVTDLGFDVEVKFYSPHPFPWRRESGGLRDEFQVAAWEALSANPEQPFYRVESQNGVDLLRYATADVMRASCVECHNTHPDSPKSDWQIGDLRGVLELKSSLVVGDRLAQANLRKTLVVIFAIGLCGTGTIYLVTTRFRRDAERLEHLVREKTAALKANRVLSDVNAELEQFAFVASHDLQEPLRKISSFCQLLKKDYGHQLDQEGREYLDVAIQGAKRLRTLVRDLLAFSRITTRGQPLAPTSANACLQTAISDLEITIEENNAQVTYDALPLVMADESQFTHLFQNLLSNAIKYRGEAAPKIHVGGRRLGNEFEFFVRDNGIGIEPEFHEKIFGIFQRLHNRREYSGTGIGLALCKRIVERFGGRIWVESAPGAGSTFYFTMKFVEQQEAGGVGSRELAGAGAYC